MALTDAGVLPPGTKTAQTMKAVGEIVGGIGLTVFGIGGAVGGTALTATGGGAAAGAPVVVASAELVTAPIVAPLCSSAGPRAHVRPIRPAPARALRVA